MSLVSSDELAKDVTGAEALLERHQVNFDRMMGAILIILVPLSIEFYIHIGFRNYFLKQQS